ncbi:MAG: (d)CMP kinase [Candidatus Methylomirabilales bacterium]
MSRVPKDLIITVDGPVAAGKTTTARLLAGRLGYSYIDSGAMYRALGWKAIQEGVDLSNPALVLDLLTGTKFEFRPTSEGLQVVVDGEDVTDELRLASVATAASVLSIHPRVREELVKRQRELGAQGGVVMDGRDIGTVVFPDAHVKFYLSASTEERGHRRFRESPQGSRNLETILAELERRDRRDMEREASPLKASRDAIFIDTTFLSPEDVVSKMEVHIYGRLKNPP